MLNIPKNVVVVSFFVAVIITGYFFLTRTSKSKQNTNRTKQKQKKLADFCMRWNFLYELYDTNYLQVYNFYSENKEHHSLHKGND